MSKPRIAIPIVVQFSVRYVLRTGLLKRMCEYAQPVVLLRWHDEELRKEMEEVGAEVHWLPAARFNAPYYRIKRQIDILHLMRLQSPSTSIKERRRNKLNPWKTRLRTQLRDEFYKAKLMVPGMPARLFEQEQLALQKYTNVLEFHDFFELIAPDVVLSLTPYLGFEQLFLQVAKRAGTSLVMPLLSFDNLTTRGWIPVIFDAYFLWNRYNEEQLYRAYPEAKGSEVTVVGAPQFDFYWDNTYLWSEDDWRTRLGLPKERPVLLYGANMPIHVPHEPHWVMQIDEAIQANEISCKPVILLRRHPNDLHDRWSEVIRAAQNIVVDDPWPIGQESVASTDIRRVDIERLASSLAYSNVHVNACSTMTIDGAIFDRPQIGPAYDDRPGRKWDRITQELYSLEHYLPITKSGGLDIVYSRDAMISAINAALNNPSELADGRRRIVREICTYDDGHCTERLNAAIKGFLEQIG